MSICVPMLGDHPPGIGPLGGLIALLERGGDRQVLAVACDLPFVSTRPLERLLWAPDGPIIAPLPSARWQPLCARCTPAGVLDIALRRAQGPHHSLQGFLDEAGAKELVLTDDEAKQLQDWDTPADVRAAMAH